MIRHVICPKSSALYQKCPKLYQNKCVAYSKLYDEQYITELYCVTRSVLLIISSIVYHKSPIALYHRSSIALHQVYC